MIESRWIALAALAVSSSVAAQGPVAAPAVADLSYAPVSAGSWGWRGTATGSEATFVDPSGIARLVVRCTRPTRRITIARWSAAPAATLTLWTSSASRALPARFDSTALQVSAELGPSDGLLDAIAFSRGRIGVAMAGSSPLVVPSWPEPARSIEDCRN